MRPLVSLITLLAVSPVPGAEAPADTADPLKAFVLDQYPRGDDYFIHGRRDTILIRCVVDLDRDGRVDWALSEGSIWGNRTGPFEIFLQGANGRFSYQRTADYESALKSVCAHRLESCRSNEYLASGRCKWKKGWR